MIRFLLKVTSLVFGALLLSFSLAQASVVEFTTTSLGGNLWRYDYTINNMSPSLGFDELTLYFDVNSFGLLNAPTAPPGWDPIVIQRDTGLLSDGFFDVLNLGGLVSDGISVSGFSVEVSYFGGGAPGAQSFDLLDSSTFTVVFSGQTVQLLDPVPVPVPAPATGLLVVLALGIAGAVRQTRNHLAP